ncbi:MAG TPA: hypothetical protein DEA40_07240 [Parvularcula sp.]|nr:hypothetical protein [Parvularcula sp.]
MIIAKSNPKIKPAATLALSVSRDIPLDKLMLSQSNIRQVKAGVSIEDLTEDIARRTLLCLTLCRQAVGQRIHADAAKATK